jgi:cytochrome d ubiquinol oxidase subunit II
MSMMAAVLVFLMFVQGGQSLIYQIGKQEKERNMIINTMGRKWEATFTTLVTFGAAFFASFPLFYSTSFSGAFWAWIIILFSFIIQAVSYEYRRKPDNFLGRKTFDAFLFINGIIGPLLIGTVVGTFFNGSDFSINNMNMPTWHNPARGLEAFGNFYNVSLGLAVLFLSRVLGLLYIINTINSPSLWEQTKKHLVYNFIPFLAFFLIFLFQLITVILMSFLERNHNMMLFLILLKNLKMLLILKLPTSPLILMCQINIIIFKTYLYFRNNNHKCQQCRHCT